MLWTALDEDTLQQCDHCIRNCDARSIRPMPWFTLVRRMYKELARNGLIERIDVKQEVCTGCVWATEDTKGCLHHYTGAHVDQQSGKVLFCPGKTTQAMRDKQLELLHGKKKRA